VSFQNALSLNPGYPFLAGAQLHNVMQLCDWQGLREGLQSLQDHVRQSRPVTTPFVVTGLLDEPALHREVAQIYIQTRYPQSDVLGPIPARMPSQKIRIGYYSADFRNHAIAYLIAETLEKHDKDVFDIYAFKLNPGPPDETSQRIFAAVSQVIDLSDKSDRSAAQLSRALNIDIAIDLGGHTVDSRTGVFAHRCAPVQVNYLGFPGTLGAPYYDYILADATVIPEDQREHYVEKVVYLPHCYQPNDSQRKISQRLFSRSEVGLPEHGFVFCCFNNGYKILPATFDGWMRILQAVEGSVLWLLDHNPVATRNLQREAQARGIDANRLIFAARMPLADHLARHRLADLFIDTLPYNAHTTASDALWAGLPVLTCMGTSFAARVAASLLRTMDLPELITLTQATFESRAIELAKNPSALGAIKSKVLAHRETSPLFNAQLFTRHIEAAYRTMQSRQQAGSPPEHFSVAP
jgi:predicted O-linked N-acetylglucosamine transferase (SPINDLY family)